MVIKRWLLPILFLVSLSLVQAETEKFIIDAGSSVILNGKNVTLIGVSSAMISVNVDGVYKNINIGETDFVNGVNINVSGASLQPPRGIMILTVDFSCGDGTCSEFEDQRICCSDCGCLDLAFACVANVCVENITTSGAGHECLVDDDCTDNVDRCKVKFCDTASYPNKCSFSLQKTCSSDDGCCPIQCDTEEDNDCTDVDKCVVDNECLDDNPCTTDTCTGTPKRCENKVNPGCSIGDRCMSVGTIDLKKYCDNTEWVAQKEKGVKCGNDYECLSNNCFASKCVGTLKEQSTGWILKALMFIVLLVVIVYVFMATRQKMSQ